MITDLVQIKLWGEKKRAENNHFRLHLKRHGYIERNFRKIAERVEDDTDCLACAQCCKQSVVRLLERDIEKLAKFLRISPGKFKQLHAEEIEEETYVLKRDDNGCQFLIGNECSVYEARPSSCQNFPHMMRGAGSFHSRMWDMVDRATYCPIVFNSLEEMKRETDFPMEVTIL